MADNDTVTGVTRTHLTVTREYLGFKAWLLSSVTPRLLTSIPSKTKTGSRC